jgi:hypothetical protein
MSAAVLARVVALALLAGPAPAQQPPIAGDCAWLGFRIGERHPAAGGARTTYVAGFAQIAVGPPHAPPDVDEVLLYASMRSRTIATIAGTATFATEEDAERFAAAQAASIERAHPGAAKRAPEMRSETLRLEAGRCEISVRVLRPSPWSADRWAVDLAMSHRRGSPEWLALRSLVAAEEDELMSRIR